MILAYIWGKVLESPEGAHSDRISTDRSIQKCTPPIGEDLLLGSQNHTTFTTENEADVQAAGRVHAKTRRKYI
jgi:hypothetical protein